MCGITVADIAEKIRFYRAVGKEFAINTLVVETRHRSAIKTKSARRENEISALKRTVAERGLCRESGIVKPVLRLWFLRIKKGNGAREIRIVGDDRRCRRGHRLPDIFGYEIRPES